MRKCRYQGDLDCTEPLLLCKACPVARKASEDSREVLVRKPTFPKLPDPRPFVSISGNQSEEPGFTITIGVKGTF